MSPTSLLPSSKTLPPVVFLPSRTRSQPRLSTPSSKIAILSGGCSPVSSNLLGVVKCSSEEKASSTAKMKDLLAELVDERVGELLSREEDRGLFDGLEKATQRVEIAKKELLQIEKQEEEAKGMQEYIQKLANREAEVRFYFIFMSFKTQMLVFVYIFCISLKYNMLSCLVRANTNFHDLQIQCLSMLNFFLYLVCLMKWQMFNVDVYENLRGRMVQFMCLRVCY